MLRHKKRLLGISLIALFLLSVLAFASPQAVEHRSVLSGTVVNVTPAGTAVQEGAVLVTVQTLTGPIPAARATVDGTIQQVFVKQGDTIHQGDLVAKVNPAG